MKEEFPLLFGDGLILFLNYKIYLTLTIKLLIYFFVYKLYLGVYNNSCYINLKFTYIYTKSLINFNDTIVHYII